ncbi:MAG: hypothetical protein AB7F88_07115 [Pyrinomonadaceae bacterium]
MQKQRFNIEGQYRTMAIIWASLVMSQVFFLVLVYFTQPGLLQFDFSRPPIAEGNGAAMITGFAIVALITVTLSFVFKKRRNEQAVAEQKPAHLQAALIIALALCEVSSLLGVVLAFVFEYQYFFLWIALGILGMIFHFPRRSDLHAASYKNPLSS